MNQIDNDKVGLKFWIAALAFSIMLLAITFALMANYLAEIKGNTLTAITRTDIVADRLNTLDVEIAAIHHHLVAEKAAATGGVPAAANASIDAAPANAPAAAPAPAAETAQPLVKDVTPPSTVKDAAPSVQPPSLAAPTTPPAKP